MFLLVECLVIKGQSCRNIIVYQRIYFRRAFLAPPPTPFLPASRALSPPRRWPGPGKCIGRPPPKRAGWFGGGTARMPPPPNPIGPAPPPNAWPPIQGPMPPPITAPAPAPAAGKRPMPLFSKLWLNPLSSASSCALSTSCELAHLHSLKAFFLAVAFRHPPHLKEKTTPHRQCIASHP